MKYVSRPLALAYTFLQLRKPTFLGIHTLWLLRFDTRKANDSDGDKRAVCRAFRIDHEYKRENESCLEGVFRFFEIQKGEPNSGSLGVKAATLASRVLFTKTATTFACGIHP